MYHAIRGARSYVATARGLLRAEMTSDESAKDSMTPVLHDGAVLGMGAEAWFRIATISVIITTYPIIVAFHGIPITTTFHLAEVPKAKDLRCGATISIHNGI